MKQKTVSLLVLLFIALSAIAQQSTYRMSRQELESYLSRSMTIAVKYNIYEANHNDLTRAALKIDLDLIRATKPKFIGRVAGPWCQSALYNYPSFIGTYFNNPNREGTSLYLDKVKHTADTIHTIDSLIILQAGLFEKVDPGVNAVMIPQYVLNEFGDSRVQPNDANDPNKIIKFNFLNIIFPAERTKYYNDPTLINDPNIEETPDITQRETKMWYYFRACEFIKRGYESIHFGALDEVIRHDTANTVKIDNYHLHDVVSKVRKFARTPKGSGFNSRRGFVLCDPSSYDPDKLNERYNRTEGTGHKKKINNSYLGSYANKQLIFDFATMAVRPIEEKDDLSSIQLGDWPATIELDHIARQQQHKVYDVMYQQSGGGISPQGWYCERLPFLVEIDNSQSFNDWQHADPIKRNPQKNLAWFTDPNEQQNPTSVYGMDEITWFANQCSDYRKYWLWYAYERVHCLDNNGFLQMPGRRVYVKLDKTNLKFAGNVYDPSTPHFTVPPAEYSTIRDIWDTYKNRKDKHIFSLKAEGDSPSWGEKLYKGDFNKDGKDDILITADFSTGTSWQGFKILYNNQSQPNGFNGAISYNYNGLSNVWDASWGERFNIGDFNFDGYDDIMVSANKVLGSSWQGFVILTNNQAGSFTAQHYSGLQNASWGERFYIGDFNGDDYDDLLVTADYSTLNSWQGYKIFLNTKSPGNLFINNSISNPLTPEQSWGANFYIGDFNGDKKDDFIITANKAVANTSWPGYKLFTNTSNSTTISFSTHCISGCTAAPAYPSWGELFYVGDFNADGKDDFLIKSNYALFGASSDAGYRVYFSNGNNTFDPQQMAHWQLDCFPSYKEKFLVGNFSDDNCADFIVTADSAPGNSWNGWKLFTSNCREAGRMAVSNEKDDTNNSSKDLDIKIFPNPTKDVIQVEIINSSNKLKINKFRLLSMDGKTLVEGELDGEINLNTVPVGIYIFEATLGENIIRKKVVKL